MSKATPIVLEPIESRGGDMIVQGISAHGTRILHILAALGPGPVEARELFGAARISPAVGYPIVHRLCDRGLVRRQWEDIDPVSEGRPRACSYELTELGTAQETATRLD